MIKVTVENGHEVTFENIEQATQYFKELDYNSEEKTKGKIFQQSYRKYLQRTISTKRFNSLSDLKQYVIEMEQKENDEKHQKHIDEQKHLVKCAITSAFNDVFANKIDSIQNIKTKIASDILMDAVEHWYSIDRGHGDVSSFYFTVDDFITYLSSRNHAFDLPWNSTKFFTEKGYSLSEFDNETWVKAIVSLIVSKQIDLWPHENEGFVIVPDSRSNVSL